LLKKRRDGAKFKYNLPQVFHWARVHEANDPRDRNFAFLSHIELNVIIAKTRTAEW